MIAVYGGMKNGRSNLDENAVLKGERCLSLAERRFGFNETYIIITTSASNAVLEEGL